MEGLWFAVIAESVPLSLHNTLSVVGEDHKGSVNLHSLLRLSALCFDVGSTFFKVQYICVFLSFCPYLLCRNYFSLPDSKFKIKFGRK